MTAEHASAAGPSTAMARLAETITGGAGKGQPPVEKWHPEHCGDIGMAIARDGTWSYQQSPIRRRSLVKLFASVLRHDDDGAHYLVTPVEKIVVHVEDAPFVAVEMAVDGEGDTQTLAFRTNVDDLVEAGPGHPLRFADSGDGVPLPYLRVRGRLDALVARAIYYDLVDLAQEHDAGGGRKLGIWSGGTFFAFPGFAFPGFAFPGFAFPGGTQEGADDT